MCILLTYWIINLLLPNYVKVETSRTMYVPYQVSQKYIIDFILIIDLKSNSFYLTNILSAKNTHSPEDSFNEMSKIRDNVEIRCKP